MAISIASPKYSFVRFAPDDHGNCAADAEYHLPVVLFDDYAFQFFVNTDTKAEADALFDRGNGLVTVALTLSCGGATAIDYTAVMGLKPQRRRAGEKQVLYYWPHGMPLFDAHAALYQCFFLKVTVAHPTAGTVTACTQAFQRIPEDCYTSVLTYGSDQNIFDFNYCGSGAVDTGTVVQPPPAAIEDCVPVIYRFENIANIDYTYTADMRRKFGDIPTVEVWILDEVSGQYVKPVIQEGFDTYPATRILIDLGGPATGYLKIS